MRECIQSFVGRVLTTELVAGKDVVESGALDYNGSIRPLIESMHPKSYIGTDMQPGVGVDVVCMAEDLVPDSADILVSAEMLEHAEDWRAAVLGLVHAVRMNGLLLITVPGPGFPRHNAPSDYQRFSVEIMERIMNACGVSVIECESVSDVRRFFLGGGRMVKIDFDSTNFIGKRIDNPKPELLNQITPEPVPDYDGVQIL
jgi:hypothetical protein